MNRREATELMKGQKKQPKKKELIFVSADRVKFKEVVPGASRAVLWGNDDTGPYGAFTRFVPGFDSRTAGFRSLLPMHTLAERSAAPWQLGCRLGGHHG